MFDAFAALVDVLAHFVLGEVPSASRPPSQIVSLIKQCEAKNRPDLAQKILDQWVKVLDKYPQTRLNWMAASKIAGASIKKNVFGGMEFVDWFAKEVSLTPAEEKKAADSPLVVIPANTPALQIPKDGETPEDWQAAAAETAHALKQARDGFKSAEEYFAFIDGEISKIKEKISAYSAGGSKHLTKKGVPDKRSERIPKWERELDVYVKVFSEMKEELGKTKDKFNEAAVAYETAPVTTVEYEVKVQDSLADILSYILTLEDSPKKRDLLTQFQKHLKEREKEIEFDFTKKGDKVVAEKAEAGSIGTFLESIWKRIVALFTNLISWFKGLDKSVDKFSELAHLGRS